MKLVLLHAFPLDERMWEPQRPVLEGLDVSAPPLYGRGRSLDDWAASVLAEVEGDELVAVGASMGGYVALGMARLAPERVAGLVLAGSRAGPDSPERRQGRDEMIAVLREQGVSGWWPQDGLGGPDEIVLEQRAEDLIGALEVLRDRPDQTAVVASFGGPFLLVVGDHDELVPADEARSLSELAPHGRLEVIEGAGHLVSLDRPEEFNRLLRDFLADERDS